MAAFAARPIALPVPLRRESARAAERTSEVPVATQAPDIVVVGRMSVLPGGHPHAERSRNARLHSRGQATLDGGHHFQQLPESESIKSVR
eukprot:11262609-Heterocapsa_arctica.AAC.1